MKSGFVTLIGRPNVGKSTLINSIVGRKVAITSSKPQTTRNIIQGIYNEEDTQIIFVDTPGIHKPNHKLGEYLNKQAYYSINDVDVVMFLIDASMGLGKGDEFIIEHLKKVDKPVILIINKIDKLTKEELMETILKYKDLYDFAEIVPISATKKNNLKELVDTLKKYLPDNIKYYDDDTFTNRSMNFIMAEIIREKIFRRTEEEVPHAITCAIEGVEKNNNAFHINAVIIVERDSLKKIIIGKQGQMIKQIGIESRIELETLLNKKVHLELFVKTIKDWRNKEKYLSEFGYKDFE